MQHIVDTFKQSVTFGEGQSFGGMCVFPIFFQSPKAIRYLSLKKALSQNLLIITEVSEGGSVPHLKAINKADVPVMLLDGEEIAGAKQNRILNTTILLKEHSETIIPVSCTERGRWSFQRPFFEESGHVMSYSSRSVKMKDVFHSLKSSGTFRSDQGKVWSEIDRIMERLAVHSRTDAMKDVYEARTGDLEEYMRHFPKAEKQTGIAVGFENRIVGLDFVSDDDVWADLHDKVVKSYAVECLGRSLKDCEPDKTAVDDFLNRLAECREESFQSVGYGLDVRFENGELIGSALVWQDEIIHFSAYGRFSEPVATDIRYHNPGRRFNFSPNLPSSENKSEQTEKQKKKASQ